jgi:hypothetical protein
LKIEDVSDIYLDTVAALGFSTGFNEKLLLQNVLC